MADSYAITYAGGVLNLNATFHPEQLEPGSVSSQALARTHLGRVTRVGDGLATPAPYILTGRLWRDDGNVQLLFEELQCIQEAITTASALSRTNEGGTTSIPLIGGSVPGVVPGVLGEWVVTVELWPESGEVS